MGPVAQSVWRLATGWTVRVSNPGWGARFSAPVQTGPGVPPSFLYNGYRVFPGGKERPGRDADPSPPSSAVGHERVELYLYSPYGPYGLYRALVPVQGSTLLIATGYGLDGPGSNLSGARFSPPVQTGPGAHPASCTMGTGSFPGVKSGRDETLTPHPLLVPWS